MNLNVTIKTKDPRLSSIKAMLAQVLSNQRQLLQRSEDMSETLNRLKEEVAQTRGVVDSAVALIGGIAEQIRERAGDEEAMEALANDLDAQQTSLAQAISAFPAASGTGGSTAGSTEETNATGTTPEPAVQPAPDGSSGSTDTSGSTSTEEPSTL